jgi:hypothetical protein
MAFNRRNFWLCLAISSGMISFGYGNSYIGVTLGEPTFINYMRLGGPNAAPDADDLNGAISGVYMVSRHRGFITQSAG